MIKKDMNPVWNERVWLLVQEPTTQARRAGAWAGGGGVRAAAGALPACWGAVVEPRAWQPRPPHTPSAGSR